MVRYMASGASTLHVFLGRSSTCSIPITLIRLPISGYFNHPISRCFAAQKFSQTIHYTTMNPPNSQQDCKEEQVKKQEKRERCAKESCDELGLGAKKRFSDDIIPHILNLYGSCATAGDFEIYAPDASFEDPLMSAHGIQQIKSAFYSISKVFTESKIVEYNVKENIPESGKLEILIENKQHYKMLGKNIDMNSLIKLYVENGKVVRHEDWWDKEPIENRETSRYAALGKLKEIVRRGSMMATHAMMGFGKDPNPQTHNTSKFE
ncbi:uncharacterized protein [Euphorbia lathyris]|uniref:uncharacterized protein isoform X2 n=1 Tax=Euphorbia lathyris TaxID=212925 RepID=UPI00331423C8